MSKAATETVAAAPLTTYSEDEQMFRASVREFAEGEIRPRVEEMDEHAKMSPDVVRQLFELGLMGVETPEEYGGAGASFFTAIIGVEELSRVDPSVGVLMDVQNTLVNNALIRWGSPEQKKKYLPRLASDTVGAYALSEAGSGSDAFAMQTRAVERGDHYELTGQKLWITNGRGGLPRHHGLRRREEFRGLLGRQEGEQARHPRLLDDRDNSRRLQGAQGERARRGGQGLQGLD